MNQSNITNINTYRNQNSNNDTDSSNVIQINKYLSPENKSHWNYKDSKFRKFIGATAVVATLLTLGAGVKSSLEGQPDVFSNSDKTSERVIKPGENLWMISGEIDEQIDGIAGNMDRRAIIEDLVDRNPQLTDPSKIRAGEKIIVPDYSGLVESYDDKN